LPNNVFFDFLSDKLHMTFDHGVASVYSYMISTAVGYSVAYVLNRKISFKSDANLALSTVLYALMVVFTIFANAIIGPIIDAAVAKTGMPDILTQIVGKFITMAVPGLWTYPCNRFIIHRKKKAVPELAEAE
jgi:putative flippase GtrA